MNDLDYICYKQVGGGFGNRLIQHCQVKIFADLLGKKIIINQASLLKDKKYKNLNDIFVNDIFFENKKPNFSIGGAQYALSYRERLLSELNIKISKEEYKERFFKNVRSLEFNPELISLSDEYIANNKINLSETLGVHIRTDDFKRLQFNKKGEYIDRRTPGGNYHIDIMCNFLWNTKLPFDNIKEKESYYWKYIDYVTSQILKIAEQNKVKNIFLSGKDHCLNWPIFPAIEFKLKSEYNTIRDRELQFRNDSSSWHRDLITLSKCKAIAATSISTWSNMAGWMGKKDIIDIFNLPKKRGMAVDRI